MKILTKNHCLAEFVDWCAYALLDLSPEAIKEILARRELFQMIHSKDADLSSLYFCGISGEFYEGLDLEKLLDKKQQKQFEENSFVVLPDDFKLDNEPQRTEIDRLIVEKDGFYWKCVPKHTDVDVETPELKYELLFRNSE